MTAPGSPWITMYLVDPRYSPVGARDPGSAKSFIIATISSGLNYTETRNDQHHKILHFTHIRKKPISAKSEPLRKENADEEPSKEIRIFIY